MQTDVVLRKQMMGIAKTAIEDPGANQKIVFKDAGDVILCEVPFKELFQLPADAKYEFRALDDTNVLKSVVIASGTVTDFTIEGYNGISVVDALQGTVGNLRSQADIKFNKVVWSIGSTITLTSIRSYISQGL